jgi:hypothetical protein
MALEDKGAQHDKVIVDKFIDPAVTTVMTQRDYVVRPSANATSGPILLVLPPVAEAKGRFYSIVVRDADNTNTITVTDQDDSECWTDIVLDSKCDRLLMFSDGLFWHPLAAITTVYPEGYDYDYKGQG